MKNQASAQRGRDGAKVLGVTREHDVVADERAHHDGAIHDVRTPRPSAGGSHRSAGRFRHRFDRTTCE
jgi:hypothetical protein